MTDTPSTDSDDTNQASLDQSSTIEAQSDNLTGTIDIAADGDIVLAIVHNTDASEQAHRFRVKSSTLQTASKYFASLLQGQFGESNRIAKERSLLKDQYGSDMSGVPSARLPVIHIEDIGRISPVKSIKALCTDFLLILHGKDLHASLPVANLANLSIVADRFSALDHIRAYVKRKRMIRAIDGKTNPKIENALTEEKIRQRLLVSVLLDYGPWLERYSARLIIKGWVGREDSDSTPSWWDLPSRLEDELSCRRDYVLDTIQAMQDYLLALYTSRDRQCRLGYDSSAQCDSFQLGEMIKFFTRLGTVQIGGTIFSTTDSPPPFASDINALIETLRQVPEYQIDRNHSHCGIRARLIPLLDLLAESLQHIGICADCWMEHRTEYAWIEAKRPLLWKKHTFRLRNLGHKETHASVRAFFTANDRDWSP